MFQDRIPCRNNIFRRKVVDLRGFGCALCLGKVMLMDRLFVMCVFVSSI